MTTQVVVHAEETLVSIAAAVKALWDQQHRVAVGGGMKPIVARFEDLLAEAVQMAASRDAASHAALQFIYPKWLPTIPSSPVKPFLHPGAAKALAVIENRLGRALQESNGAKARCRSSSREAALAAWIIEADERATALDELMESLLEDNLTPADIYGDYVDRAIFETLTSKYQCLVDFPAKQLLQGLPLVINDEAAEVASRYASALAEAVRAAPPGVLRFAIRETSERRAYNGALDAPLAGASLLRQLRVWCEQTGAPKSALGLAETSALAVRSALEDWLTRSEPASAADRSREPRRQFSDWEKHIRRARTVGAQSWRPAWFAAQHDCAVAAGRRMVEQTDAYSTSLARYAHFCLIAYQSECAWLDQGDPSRYLDEVDGIVLRLTLPSHHEIPSRLSALRSGFVQNNSSADLAAFLSGEPIADEPVRKRQERFLNLKADECSSPLALWAVGRARSVPAALSLEAPALPEGMTCESALLLVADYRARAVWLTDTQEPWYSSPSAAWFDFLGELQNATVELFGQPDSAISLAMARRLIKARIWQAARQQIDTAASSDSRPNNQAMCHMLRGELALRQNRDHAHAWTLSYLDCWKAWRASCESAFQKPVSVGALLGAAVVAQDAGWHAQSARCTSVIRHAKSGGRALDRFPLDTQRVRIDNYARWSAARRGSPGARKLRLKLLEYSIKLLTEDQNHFVENNETLVNQRRIVALLAAATPGNCLLPNLVSCRTPGHRLHALAVALQRNGRRSIDDYVKNAAIWRLDQTADAVTFIGAWLAGRYFDDPNFEHLLGATLQAMRARKFGADAIERLFGELTELMAEEVSARCADAVRSAAAQAKVGDQVADLTALFRGGLERIVQPQGYGGSGNLFIDADVLAEIVETTCAVTVDLRQELWVESLFGARALDTLRRHLFLDKRGQSRGQFLSGLVRDHEAIIGLSQDSGIPLLTYDGTVMAKHGVVDKWREGTAIWANSLRRSVNNLGSRRPGIPSPVCEVDISECSMSVKITIPLWKPAETKKSDDATMLLALMDRHYGLHLARLSQRMPNDVSGRPTMTLHSAVASLLKLVKPRTISRKERWSERLAASAIINAAAAEAWRIIRLPAGRLQAPLFAVLEAVAATQTNAVAVPFESATILVALPETQLRLVLQILLENAAKASGQTGDKSHVSIAPDEHGNAVLTLTSPYLADYPNGWGVGVQSITSVVEFYGGALSQSRLPGTALWQVLLRLPLARQEGETEGSCQILTGQEFDLPTDMALLESLAR